MDVFLFDSLIQWHLSLISLTPTFQLKTVKMNHRDWPSHYQQVTTWSRVSPRHYLESFQLKSHHSKTKQTSLEENLGVYKNNGTPKSSILIGFSIINHPFWGTPIFGSIHLVNLTDWTSKANSSKISTWLAYHQTESCCWPGNVFFTTTHRHWGDRLFGAWTNCTLCFFSAVQNRILYLQ